MRYSKAGRWTLALIVLLLSLPCASAQIAPGEAERIRRVEMGLRPYCWALFGDEERFPLLERMKLYKVPGLSIAVIENGRLVWAKGYGVKDIRTQEPVTVETLFQAASISKALNAAAIMREVDQGRLTLDRDVNDYLRSWKVPLNEFTATEKVTISRLLSHTAGTTDFNDRSGYFGYHPTDLLPTIQQMLRGVPPSKTPPVRVEKIPGQSFRYSNGGTMILQLVLTELESKPYAQILQEAVFEPLGMDHSIFAQPLPAALAQAAATAHDLGAPLPGGGMVYPELAAAGLWTTPSDLAKFLIEIWLSLQGRSNKIVSQISAEGMIAPVVAGSDYTRGFEVNRRGGEVYFGHRGGNYGFYSNMIINLRTGSGAIVMANGGGDALNSNLRREVLIALAEEYGWPEYQPPRLKIAAVSPEQMERITGRYLIGDDSAITIEHVDGKLIARSPERIEALYPVSDFEMAAKSILPSRYRLIPGDAPQDDVMKLIVSDREQDARRMSDGQRTPFDYLVSGHIDQAVALYRTIRAGQPGNPAVQEARINRLGYRLLGQGKMEEAIALFQLNTEWYPHSANAYDSLGEAYGKAGNSSLSYLNYEKSLRLKPDNHNARQILERMKEIRQEKK